MKTAIICGAGIVSGKEVMALELGHGLRTVGHDVVYVTTKWGNGEFARQLADFHLRFYPMRLGFISATLNLECLRMTAEQALWWPSLLLDYRRFLVTEAPTSVLHTNWHHLILLLPFLRPDRDIFWLHETVPNLEHYRRLFRLFASRLRCFVAVSDAVSRSLASASVATSSIHTIYNGVRDFAGQHQSSRAAPKEMRVGIVGQVGDWKGHEDLIEAFSILAPRHPSARLHIVGASDGEYAQYLKRRAEVLGLTDRIVWRGFVRDRSEIFPLLDVCVAPSRIDESFGLVAVEAALHRLPVVATRGGGLQEIIVDGVTGYLVNRESPTELAERLDRLLGSPQLREKMGLAAREHVVVSFSRERLVKNFNRLLISAK